MKLSDYLRIRRKELKLTLMDVANYTGVSAPTVTRWETGEIKHIKSDKLQKLADILEVPVQYLLGELDYNQENDKKMKPILGFVKAGYDMYAQQQILGYEEVSERDAYLGDYFLSVKGDSMSGSNIYDGSKVYIKHQSDVNNGDIAVVLIGNEEATIKKVIKKDNLLILEATNPQYDNKYFTKQEVEELPISIIGKVLWCKIEF